MLNWESRKLKASKEKERASPDGAQDIRRWHHEGIAASSPLWLARSRIHQPELLHTKVLVVNTYIEGCEQGLEIGFGDPAVEIHNSTLALNSAHVALGQLFISGGCRKLKSGADG